MLYLQSSAVKSAEQTRMIKPRNLFVTTLVYSIWKGRETVGAKVYVQDIFYHRWYGIFVVCWCLPNSCSSRLASAPRFLPPLNLRSPRFCHFWPPTVFLQDPGPPLGERSHLWPGGSLPLGSPLCSSGVREDVFLDGQPTKLAVKESLFLISPQLS